MKKYFFMLLLSLALHASAKEMIKTDTLSFVLDGKNLTGLLDQPCDKKPAGLILLIPGSGKTTMVEGNGYYEHLRHFLVGEGFACYVWDKPGCGKSAGVFDNNQPIDNTVQEALAAITALKHLNIPGSDKIGLWSLSRGGWVCPSIIKAYPSIAFWISVSGPDAEETFGYLLERNFLAEGRSKEETKILIKAWHDNLDIARHGGTYEENQKATECLRKDSFYMYICKGSPKPTREGYIKWQKTLLNGENMPVNEKTGLQVYFPDLENVLKNINCPVLAIFGEKDCNVDWQKTTALYKNTIGKNPDTLLTIKTFPDGNHNLFKCKTGGIREKLDKIEFCDGYFEAMAGWLKKLEEKEHLHSQSGSLKE